MTSHNTDIIMIPKFLDKEICNYLKRFVERHKSNIQVNNNKSTIDLQNTICK